MPPHIVEIIIQESKEAVRQIVETSRTDSMTIIQRYVAAVAGNFTDWIGKTIPSARHELARYALTDNLRCESEQDHVGMLFEFALRSHALPEGTHYSYVLNSVEKIRGLFKDWNTAGLSGVALCAALENTSEVFIPDLERRAIELGCNDLTYTKVHGVADIEHSRAFSNATIAEFDAGYNDPEIIVRLAVDSAQNLIHCIYS